MFRGVSNLCLRVINAGRDVGSVVGAAGGGLVHGGVGGGGRWGRSVGAVGGRELLSSCFPVSTLRFPELRVSASSTVKAEIHAGLRYYVAGLLRAEVEAGGGSNSTIRLMTDLA